MKSLFEGKNNNYASPIPYIAILAVLFIARIVEYFTFSPYKWDREIYYRRMLMEALYVIFAIISGTTVGVMSTDFLYFVNDGIILS